MTATYPQYSPDATCPKCDGRNIDSSYQGAGSHFGGCPSDGETFVLRSEGAMAGPEWQLRTCRWCGYAWPEMCADGDEESPA